MDEASLCFLRGLVCVSEPVPNFGSWTTVELERQNFGRGVARCKLGGKRQAWSRPNSVGRSSATGDQRAECVTREAWASKMREVGYHWGVSCCGLTYLWCAHEDVTAVALFPEPRGAAPSPQCPCYFRRAPFACAFPFLRLCCSLQSVEAGDSTDSGPIPIT